jgi:DNA (cytosine-5)-methyltransferase 1
MRPRLLDLYCGAGGAGMGYSLAGFEVVGVDKNPQPHYPFAFIQADVMTLDQRFLGFFEAIHASPPCQKYSQMQNMHGNSDEHPDLVAPTRRMLQQARLPYVIENVEGAPVRPDMMLCGSMFGLKIAKHRWFELSFTPPADLLPPCDHSDLYDPWHGPGRTADKFRAAQGTPWIPMAGGASRKRGATGDLFNAIPPAFTQHIGAELMRVVMAERQEAVAA